MDHEVSALGSPRLQERLQAGKMVTNSPFRQRIAAGGGSPRHEQADTTRYFKTEIDQVPVTKDRPPAVDLHRKGLIDAGVPRATSAPTLDKPHGSGPIEGRHLRENRTVLQRHCDFFDRNQDGVINMADTFVGFRHLGFNIFFSFLAVLVIHFGFSFVTRPGMFPDPFFRLHLDNIHCAKHGSDQSVYDTEGRFVPQKYEDIFTKWDRGDKGGLDLKDIWRMTQQTMNAMDFFGWFAGKFEWLTLWLLTADERGLVTKEAVRSCYDGTLFYRMEQKFWKKEEVPDEFKKMGDRMDAKKRNTMKELQQKAVQAKDMVASKIPSGEGSGGNDKAAELLSTKKEL